MTIRVYSNLDSVILDGVVFPKEPSHSMEDVALEDYVATATTSLAAMTLWRSGISLPSVTAPCPKKAKTQVSSKHTHSSLFLTLQIALSGASDYCRSQDPMCCTDLGYRQTPTFIKHWRAGGAGSQSVHQLAFGDTRPT